MQWQTAGSPSKENWGFKCLGHVGDDRIARRITPLIRKWPGESQHRRAVMGLDILLAIGTDIALMNLNGIAQKVKFKGIKDAARERIQELANRLGLTSEQLADRLVPDLGLEANGTLRLDYGARSFTVGFNEHLAPFVKDETGKLRKTLPKPGVRDDEALAEPAFQRFKQLKKDVRAIAKLQVARFEKAMLLQRRWTVPEFQEHLVQHPLIVHVVRRLIWGVFAEDGSLSQTFRVAEDGSYADQEDEVVSPPKDGLVGIVHAIELEPQTAADWGDVLSDYEILQPFAQLGRPLFRLTPEEKTAMQWVRNPKQSIPVGRVVGLVNRGWERGEPMDGGAILDMSYPLPDGRNEVRMVLGGGGVWVGYISEQDEDPTIESIVVCRCGDWSENPSMPLGEVPEAIMSEVIAAVHDLQRPVQA